LKPLDFVKTPKGNIAIVTEINEKDYGSGISVSIEFLGGGNPTGEKNAWWDMDELAVVDNLPSLLARNLVHPFGSGKKPALKSYPIKAG
jgi:hypothetical protein